MRTIICGSRHGLPDGVTIQDAVDASGFEVTELVHGGAEGVDGAASHWAYMRNMRSLNTSFIRVNAFPVPDWVWRHLGPKAGPIRNGYMARYADACIALPGGRGTRNMVMQAREHGLKVYCHGWEG